ncbi:MAG: ABC transporter substrate-binding protein [Bacteroidota bacterium]
MKRTYLLMTIGFWIGVSLILTSCTDPQKSNSKSQEDTPAIAASVRFPIPVVDGAFAPFYIARDSGFFKKYGLDISINYGSKQEPPVTMVVQGRDEIGVLGGPELIMTAREKGAQIQAFALLHKNSNFACLITKDKEPPVKLEDLEGKDVGFFYGHISTDVIRALLKQQNITVNEVNVGFDYSQFIGDQMIAQWAFTTTAGINLPAQGVDIDIISPADYGIVSHGHTFFTSEKIIDEQPELVERFTEAMIEATQYVLDNRAAAVASTLGEAKSRNANLSEAVVMKQLDVYDTVIKNNQSLLWLDQDLMVETKERLVTLGLLSDSFNIEQSISPQFVQSFYANESGQD